MPADEQMTPREDREWGGSGVLLRFIYVRTQEDHTSETLQIC